MSTLSKLVESRRKSGQSVSSSLYESLRDKLKEKIDPRRILNQTGLLVSLFPGLKAFKANEVKGKLEQTNLFSKESYENPKLKKIEYNTEITAKNSLILPSIGRDFNVIRQNLTKAIKKIGIKPATKADMYFVKKSEAEKLYESKFVNKLSPIKTENKTGEKKNSFSWLSVLGIVGAVGAGALIVSFLSKATSDFFNKLIEPIKEMIGSFSESIMNSIEDVTDLFSNKTDNLENDLKNSLDSIESKIDGVSDQKQTGSSSLEKSVSEYKNKFLESFKTLSPISSAQAAPAPSSYVMQGTTPSPMKKGVRGSADEAVKFFMGKGWTKEQAAGIVGNLIQESGLNPMAYNRAENAQGIAQWRNERVAKFEQKYRKSIFDASFREQLEYVDWELNNTERRAGNLLRQTRTAAEAAIVVDHYYERSAKLHTQSRINYANQLLNSPAIETVDTKSATNAGPINKMSEEISSLDQTTQQVNHQIVISNNSQNFVAMKSNRNMKGVDHTNSMLLNVV